jgi:hypothetical protein
MSLQERVNLVSWRGGQPSPRLGDGRGSVCLPVPPDGLWPCQATMPTWLSTHHADLSCHKVAQSVEPFHIGL